MKIRKAILPLALRGIRRRDDLERASILVESLARYWQDDEPLELLVVSPARDAGQIRAYLPRVPNIALTIKAESEFFSAFSTFHLMTGWYRQQVIKLYVPAKLGFEGYLTLDSDVVCVGAIDGTTFVKDGKILSQWEPKYKQPWWRTISRLMQVPYEEKARGLTVTPNTLHGTLARQALTYISNDDGDPCAALNLWLARHLGSVAWTEYSLYTSVAERMGNLFDYHLSCDACYLADVHLSSARSSVWLAEDFNQLSKLPYGNDPCAKFIVVQSHLRIPIRKVRDYCDSFGRMPPHNKVSAGPSVRAEHAVFPAPLSTLGCKEAADVMSLTSASNPPTGWRACSLAVTRQQFTNSDGVSRQSLIKAAEIGSRACLALEAQNEDTEAVAVFARTSTGEINQIGYLVRGHGLRPAVERGAALAWLSRKQQDAQGVWHAELHLLIKKGREIPVAADAST